MVNMVRQLIGAVFVIGAERVPTVRNVIAACTLLAVRYRVANVIVIGAGRRTLNCGAAAAALFLCM
jgi:hypothetical protein